MNRILAASLLTLAAAAGAGLPTSGLPSGGSQWALHLSNETVDQTKVGKALTDAFQAEVDANAVVAALKRELGFELDEDFRDLTAVGNASDGNRSFAALVRGKFNKARIEDFASRNGVASRAVKGLRAWDAHDLANAVAKASGNEPRKTRDANGDFQVVIVDGSTIVIAEAANLERTVGAATSGTPWKHDGLADAAGRVQNGWLLVSADVAGFEDAAAAKRKPEADATPEAKAALAKRSGTKVVTLAVGESPADLTVRVHATFVDEAAAKKNVSQIKGFLGFGAMLTMPAEQDTPSQAASKATGADVLRRINVTQSGAAADATLDYPVQKLAEAIVRAAQTQREMKAGK